MNSVLKPLTFALAGLLFAPACMGAPRPELVREVLEGKRHEARASWWGFDAQDSTQYLQQAINSKVKTLIIDRQKSPWMTRPLTGVSNQEIVLATGTELAALKGAFQRKGDCLLTFPGCENITIRGEKKDRGKTARIRMRKEDYQSEAYEKSEWRHGLSFSACRNVLIQDLAIEQTGGDAIYLGTAPGRGPNRNVVIRRVDCNGNHRQGISVISAQDLLIEDCLLRNTSGTAPQAGIDFEPNAPGESLVRCVVRNCVAENNAGTGYQICPQTMNSSSPLISIDIENCVSRGNTQHGIHLCSAPKNAPRGLLRISRFTSDRDRMAGLSVQFNPWDGVRIEMKDSELRDCARDDAFFPPIYVQGSGADRGPAGNIHFTRVTVRDDVDRPFFRIRVNSESGVKAITGEITLKRRGATEAIKLDEARLREFSREWKTAK